MVPAVVPVVVELVVPQFSLVAAQQPLDTVVVVVVLVRAGVLALWLVVDY
jgi:hypothetical protein